MADAEAENVGTVDQGDLVQVRHIAKSSKHGSFYELKSGGFCPVEKDGQPILSLHDVPVLAFVVHSGSVDVMKSDIVKKPKVSGWVLF